MKNKWRITIENSYGKCDATEICEEFIFNGTMEEAKERMSCWEEFFESGNTLTNKPDYFNAYYSLHGDWDEPDERYLTIEAYKPKMKYMIFNNETPCPVCMFDAETDAIKYVEASNENVCYWNVEYYTDYKQYLEEKCETEN